MSLRITVNGEPLALETPLHVAALLERLRLGGKRVAVELNGEILPRSRYADTALADGDEVLVVQAIGGG